MGIQVTNGAQLQCSFGVAPSALIVPPASGVSASKMPAATIMEFTPMVNIAPFGMCSSPSNPTVAAATAAALGVLTPMPCVPAPAGPWKPGSTTVKIGKKPALTDSSICNCSYGGVIKINSAGQTSTNTK